LATSCTQLAEIGLKLATNWLQIGRHLLKMGCNGTIVQGAWDCLDHERGRLEGLLGPSHPQTRPPSAFGDQNFVHHQGNSQPGQGNSQEKPRPAAGAEVTADEVAAVTQEVAELHAKKAAREAERELLVTKVLEVGRLVGRPVVSIFPFVSRHWSHIEYIPPSCHAIGRPLSTFPLRVTPLVAH
jgi:hypothetical protein